jgi:hypothetical protein
LWVPLALFGLLALLIVFAGVPYALFVLARLGYWWVPVAAAVLVAALAVQGAAAGPLPRCAGGASQGSLRRNSRPGRGRGSAQLLKISVSPLRGRGSQEA